MKMEGEDRRKKEALPNATVEERIASLFDDSLRVASRKARPVAALGYKTSFVVEWDNDVVSYRGAPVYDGRGRPAREPTASAGRPRRSPKFRAKMFRNTPAPTRRIKNAHLGRRREVWFPPRRHRADLARAGRARRVPRAAQRLRVDAEPLPQVVSVPRARRDGLPRRGRRAQQNASARAPVPRRVRAPRPEHARALGPVRGSGVPEFTTRIVAARSRGVRIRFFYAQERLDVPSRNAWRRPFDRGIPWPRESAPVSAVGTRPSRTGARARPRASGRC